MTPQEIQQYIQAIAQGLSPLGEKVATGAKEYCALAYRQAILNGIENLCTAFVFILGIWLLWRWFLKDQHLLCGEKRPYDIVSQREAWRVGIICATALTGVIVVICINLAIDRIGNPGYQAIQSMLGSIAARGK